jgi:hypothetical protein
MWVEDGGTTKMTTLYFLWTAAALLKAERWARYPSKSPVCSSP